MEIEVIAVGAFESNCYVAWGPAREALVIDPGADAGPILRLIDAKQLDVAAYLLTHGHVDHVSALADLYDERPAPVAMHPEDRRWAFTERGALLPYYPTPREPPEIVRMLADGQEWEDGGLRYRVIATPGHSPGGVCFHFPGEEVLFSGDTLFQGSVGRTDLPGGSAAALAKSLAKLTRLPPSTRIYPGHGFATTLALEKESNYFLRGV